MNEAERISLNDALIESNRALLNIAGAEHTIRSDRDAAIRECLNAYNRLSLCQKLPLSSTESANVQGVLDRLRVQLRVNDVDL